MIWVEHDMQMVADLADRLYVLNFGVHARPTARRRRAERPARHRRLPGPPGRACDPRRIIRPRGGTRRETEMLIGTSEGLLIADHSKAPTRPPRCRPDDPRAPRRQRHPLRRRRQRDLSVDRRGAFVDAERRRRPGRVGADRGSARSPHHPRRHAAAALHRSRDSGVSWTEIDSLKRTRGAERWCLPNSPAGARARALAIDPVDPNRWWVGVEVGGVATSTDAGASWTCVAPGEDPDVHVLVGHPGRTGVLYATTGLGRFADDPQPMRDRIAGLFGSEDGGIPGAICGPAWSRATRARCASIRAPRTRSRWLRADRILQPSRPGGAQSPLYQSTDGGAPGARWATPRIRRRPPTSSPSGRAGRSRLRAGRHRHGESGTSRPRRSGRGCTTICRWCRRCSPAPGTEFTLRRVGLHDHGRMLDVAGRVAGRGRRRGTARTGSRRGRSTPAARSCR